MSIKKLHIKRGDLVKIIAGNEKNKQGRVLRVLRKENRALVEGVNKVIFHVKASKTERGGRKEKEAPLHLSNLMLIDPATQLPTRIGWRMEKKKLHRFAKKTNQLL